MNNLRNQLLVVLNSAMFMLLLSGCTVTYYYQLYEVGTTETPTNEKQYIFDYADIAIKYDFWAESGKSDFVFTNKTDKDIYLDLRSTHLILNGFANTYFQNVSYTASSNIASSATYWPAYTYSTVALAASAGNSITRMPEPVICIPANSSKVVDGFQISKTLLYNCNYELFPSKKEIKTQNFSNEDSPLEIRNIIAYGFDKSLDSINRIENDFYVSSITNYPQSGFFDSKYPEYCGKKASISRDYFVKSSPKMFFLKYDSNDTPWE